jgi:hypothetical protein
MERLHKFKELCRTFLRQGIKPTPTLFAKQGLGYVNGGYLPYPTGQGSWVYDEDGEATWHQERRSKPHEPITNPGSGCTWISGKYTQARREVMIEFGWTYKPHDPNWVHGGGVWLPPATTTE